MDESASRLIALIEGAHRLVAFTGAGVSTECGVPDFRSPGSPWLRCPPIGFQAFVSDAGQRVEAWHRKFAMDDVYAGARPGRVHHALSNLARSGPLTTVITQNIDGLHQAAGLPASKLIELHGNGTYARCLQCGLRHELAAIRERLAATGTAPECLACGGMVKSATVAFGQSLDPADVRAARDAACGCDLFLVLGSSLVVQPAASLPLLARRHGATLVIVNREATRLDGEADLVVRGDVGEALEHWSAAR